MSKSVRRKALLDFELFRAAEKQLQKEKREQMLLRKSKRKRVIRQNSLNTTNQAASSLASENELEKSQNLLRGLVDKDLTDEKAANNRRSSISSDRKAKSPVVSPNVFKPKAGILMKNRVPISNMYLSINPVHLSAINFLSFVEAVAATSRITQTERFSPIRVNIKVMRGNNEQIVQQVAKRRPWWNVISRHHEETNPPEFINLYWTQQIDEDFTRKIQDGDKNIGVLGQVGYSLSEALDFCRYYMNDHAMYMIRRYLDGHRGHEIFLEIRRFAQMHEFQDALLAYASRQKRAQDPDVPVDDPFEEKTSQKKSPQRPEQSLRDLDERSDRGSKRGIGTGTSLRSIPHSKSGLKNRQLIRTLRLHNHIVGNHELGDKMNLLSNLKAFLAGNQAFERSHQLFQMVPFTMAIGSLVDSELPRFQQIHDLVRHKNLQRSFEALDATRLPIWLDFHTIQHDKNLWILKPGENSNRGRGIIVTSDLQTITDFVKFAEGPVVLQKYIENPLLYHGRKFDIRMYILITMINGVHKLYFYRHGYARTSSFDFTLDNTHNNIHLTNEAIQIKNAEFGKFEKGNKLTLQELSVYLRKFVDSRASFSEKYIPLMKVRSDHRRSTRSSASWQRCPNSTPTTASAASSCSVSTS